MIVEHKRDHLPHGMVVTEFTKVDVEITDEPDAVFINISRNGEPVAFFQVSKPPPTSGWNRDWKYPRSREHFG